MADLPEPTPSRAPGRIEAARRVLVAGTLVGCVACDRATKIAAVALLPEGSRLSFLGDCIRLEHARNSGAFLGMGGALPGRARVAIFTWGVAVLVIAATIAAFHRRAPVRIAIAAALVAAGGLGNLWDRVLTDGQVIDFVNLGVGWVRTGIFNVADVAIVAGAALLAFAGGRASRVPPQRGSGGPA